MMNKREVLIRTYLYEAANDLLILKARDKKLLLSEQRLQASLKKITDKIVEKAMNQVLYDPSEYSPKFIALYKAHLLEAFGIGEASILNNSKISLTEAIIPKIKLDKIVDNRSFNASQSTLDRLVGDVLPRIKEGVAEGNKLGTTADSLIPEFQNMANYETMRIARTETQSVYNQSKYETLLNSTVVPYKKWVSSGLSNMRDSHAEMDGEIVPVDEPFSNGLMYPGDPDGPPEEVINCACTMVPAMKNE